MSTDEWEYEYSPHETESLYFTLDLTTHVPDALTDQPLNISGQSSKNNSAPRSDQSARNNSDDSSSGEEEDGQPQENQENLPTLQILDLHTSNPLIKFNQSVFSAYWTTDLGTQFHIAQTGQTPDPLRKGTILDVLGISRARLLGKPVQLTDRNAPPPPQPTKPSQSATPTIDLDEDYNNNEDPDSMVLTSGPLKIPRTILKTPKSLSQASFLERLSAIKLAKGEKDQVPILAVKHYTKPANAEEIKRKAEDDDRNNALVHIDGRKRRRRRPMGVKAKNAGGAGRPSRGDLEGRVGFDPFGDGGQAVDGGDDGPVGVGMFEPGGRGEMREEVVGYVEDAMQGVVVPSSDTGEGRHPGTPAMSFPSPGGRSGSTTVGERSGTESSSGYLSFQTRAEYLSTVRAEGLPKNNKQPARPPWVAGAGAEDDQTQSGGVPAESGDQNEGGNHAERGGAGDVP